MAEYIEIDQAIGMSGLRVVLSPGVPGPWSEAAKGILHVKKLPYTKVRQEVGGENLPLQKWTAQTTAPAFVYNDERPRSIWIRPALSGRAAGPRTASDSRHHRRTCNDVRLEQRTVRRKRFRMGPTFDAPSRDVGRPQGPGSG